MVSAFFAGLGLGASLIIAIGAQNAFVLRQGIRRDHAGAVAVVCVAVDWSLIAIGALGFGALVHRFPAFIAYAAWGGAVFLGVHGALSFRAAWRPGRLSVTDGRATGTVSRASLSAVVVTALAVSLLNPHVYLDTVVLLGSVAAQYPVAPRAAFVAGAGTASAAWFFGLSFGARLLAPLFEKEAAWRVLDIAVGVVMWAIAGSLVMGRLAGS